MYVDSVDCCNAVDARMRLMRFYLLITVSLGLQPNGKVCTMLSNCFKEEGNSVINSIDFTHLSLVDE